jgi:hypothetical protein
MVMMNSIVNEAMYNEMYSFLYCASLFSETPFKVCVDHMELSQFPLQDLSGFMMNHQSAFTISDPEEFQPDDPRNLHELFLKDVISAQRLIIKAVSSDSSQNHYWFVKKDPSNSDILVAQSISSAPRILGKEQTIIQQLSNPGGLDISGASVYEKLQIY